MNFEMNKLQGTRVWSNGGLRLKFEISAFYSAEADYFDFFIKFNQ